MQALDVRHLELGIVTALTACITFAAVPCKTPPRAATVHAPSPEAVAVRLAEPSPLACDADGITTLVFRGQVRSLDPDHMATFHFRFADLPSRYTVMTGKQGAFEVRVPREELGALDLCDLPASGRRPARFADASLTVQYELAFER